MSTFMDRGRIVRALGAFTALALAGAARGEVIVSNFSAAIGTGTFIGTTSTTQFKAYGFTIPAGKNYTLHRMTLTLNLDGGGVPRVAIWEGTGLPMTELAVLPNPPVQSGDVDYVFEPAPGTVIPMDEGKTYWIYVQSIDPPPGNFLWQGTSPSTVPSGAGINVGYIFNGAASTTRNRLELTGFPVSNCYADCDESGSLDFFDFLCFQNEFANGTSYADCDGSGSLDFFDFLCFQNEFAGGCP